MGIFSSAVDYFIRGGACMWPLLLCSILVVAIAIERISYYRNAITPSSFVRKLHDSLEQGKEAEALFMAKRTKGLAAELVAASLSDKALKGELAKVTVYSRADRAVEKLKGNMNFLSLIIGLSPMLGLLGTVTGMMAAFGAMNPAASNTAGITAGLAEALITTVFGLIIAISGMCVHAYIHYRERNAEIDIDEAAELIAGLYGDDEE